MAGFSYQQHSPFQIDPPCLPNPLIEMSFLKQAGPCNYFSCESITEATNTDARTYESSFSFDNGPKVAVQPKTQTAALEKKRKSGHESCVSPSQQPKESKVRKQKKPNGGLKGTEDKKFEDHCEKKETRASEEPPTGYIHVRARRGQATDSHSLAERVRRDRIRLRMKVLQGLVPGCDKVAGKALMLEEIINYVQSLQNQVEFLSMKLASMSPMLYDFGVDFDDCKNQPEPLPSVQQTNHILPTVHEEATSSYQLVSPPAPQLFMHGQGPDAFSQDINSYQMQAADDHHPGFIGLVGFNLCSFQ